MKSLKQKMCSYKVGLLFEPVGADTRAYSPTYPLGSKGYIALKSPYRAAKKVALNRGERTGEGRPTGNPASTTPPHPAIAPGEVPQRPHLPPMLMRSKV